MSVDRFRFLAGAAQPTLVLGRVYQAPADKQHGVRVVTESQPGFILGPMDWPRDGALLPAAGDVVVIAFPVNGDPRVVVWEHYPNT